MKRHFFSTGLLFFLCVFALTVKGDVSWQSDPMITTFPDTFNKSRLTHLLSFYSRCVFFSNIRNAV